MMDIKSTLDQSKLGEAVAYENLEMYPLLQPEHVAKDYLTLDEALKANVAHVTEVSSAGSVPELLLKNTADKAIFLLDGEELVGAKQNRILNISILAPSGAEIVIPVSCVEAGRWSHRRPDFATAPRAQFAESRAKRSAQVSEDIVNTGGRRSNQGEVWNDISLKLGSLDSHSPTQAVESAFVDHESRLGKFVENLQPLISQVGAVFCIDGRVIGLELFDSEETFTALLPKLVRSYALDAIDPKISKGREANKESLESFLNRVGEAKTMEAPAVGEGTDIRFHNAAGLAGGALLARKRLIHLVAFSLSEQLFQSSDRVRRRRAH